MSIAAAYGRISDEGQRETSIEDQLRRCREIAKREGLVLEDWLIFSDLAITGKTSGLAKRKGYQRLCDAIAARECSFVIVDEISRLTRSIHEGGRLIELVESTGIHFVTACGIDTRNDSWKTAWMLKLVIATSEVDGTSHRTTRGMIGQLERGYQIAQAPFGYRPVHETTGNGKRVGTKWVIHEPEAAIVRQIYAWRREGMSCGGIALRLKEMNVTPPGTTRTSTTPYWRQASVFRIMQNTIYRGEFVWNGSTYVQAKARKRQRQVVAVPYARAELRLVDDALWFECNPRRLPGQQSTPRGGGKHLCAGLVRCGECQNLLTVQSGKDNKSLVCSVCEQKARLGMLDGKVNYSSTKAALLALEWVLGALFKGDIREEFNRRLASRLIEGPVKELQEVTERLKAVDAVIERITSFMLDPSMDPRPWQERLQANSQEKKTLEHRLGQLRKLQQRISPAMLQAQVDTDPLPYLHDLLKSGAEAFKAKATLRRLLSKFQLVDRPRKGVSVFRIGLRPGVCLAEVSDSVTIDESVIEFEVTSSVGAARPVCWTVSGRRV